MSELLTTASIVQCPHGGAALIFAPAGDTANATGARALTTSDQHIVVGCFNLRGPAAWPCLRIQWSAGAARAKTRNTPLLTRSSVGQCLGPDGAAQGVALISSTQSRAQAT